jgi:hypothetical protein
MAVDLGNKFEVCTDGRAGVQYEYKIKELLRRELPNDYFFIHSAVLSERPRGMPEVLALPREVDFILVGPNGLFLLEVKLKDRVQGSLFGYWTYARLIDGKAVAQNLQRDCPGRTMKKKFAQAESLLRNKDGGRFKDYSYAHVIFVFPEKCEICLTDEGSEKPVTYCWVHDKDLADTIVKLPTPMLPSGDGRARKLSAAEARQLAGLFEPGKNPLPNLVGSYNIVEHGDGLEILTTPNGLRYAIHDLRQAELGYRRRGKWYDLGILDNKDKAIFREQVIHHARVQSRIGDHPHIHKHFDVIDDVIGEGYWVIEEWVDGDSLEDLLTTDRPHGLSILPFMRGVALGLMAVHNNGFVFRVLSPSSILVEHRTNRPFLTNFELAKAPGVTPTVWDSVTIENDAYMAPEAIDNPNTVDAKVDVYSWGAILYHLATGTPYGGPKTLEKLRRTSLPAPAIKLGERCLSLRRSLRPENMTEVLTTLSDERV